MLAIENLKEGNLDDAIAQIQDSIRKHPAKSDLRVFLFQLLVVMGQWDRALNQLNVLGDLDAATLAMVQTYREALACEAVRGDIFAGKRSPLMFGDPEQWIALLIEALRLTAEGKDAQSQDLRDQAFEAAPTTSGSLDGAPFAWIADADPRLGPVVEAVVNGRYYWIPFHRIKRIQIEKPVDLRDVVWLPANFTWANGGETVGLIPTRYPGSEASADNLIRLARKTEWQAREAELYLGLGQRMFATDAGEHPIMDIRDITLDTAEETPTETTEADG